MRLNKFLFTFLLFLVATPIWGQEKVVVDVELPTHIIAGQPFRVVFSANTSAKSIQLSATPEGLQQLYGPSKGTSSSMSIINGKRSSSTTTTFTYTFLAEKEGQYTIPDATVIIDNAKYHTSSRRIKVFSADAELPASSGSVQSVSAEDLYIVAIPNKTTVYEQEAVLITYRLYSRLENTQFSNFSFPDYQGFAQYVQHDGSNTQYKAEEVHGKLYYTADFYSVVLYPQHSGKLTIQPAEFEMVINMPINNPRRSFFDSFFDNFEQVNKTLKTKPITIDVRPLPTPQPGDFSGAVGEFTLKANAPDKVLKTNESFTYKVTLEGKGNIKLAQIPEPIFPEGFETFDPKEEEETGVSGGDTRGFKSKEYYAVPRHTGDFTIPSIHFSYFNTKSRKYEQIQLPEVKVHIDKGEQTQPTTVIGSNNKEEVKYLDKDIRYLKSTTQHPTLLPKGKWHLSWWIYLLLIIALILAILIDKKLEVNNADTAYNRSRKAGKTAQKYLKIASRMLGKGDAEAFYEALLKGLSDYLSNKLHLPLSQLSKENIKSAMTDLGIQDELIEEALVTLADLELARYSPNEVEGREKLFERASNVIEGIQKTKFKK